MASDDRFHPPDDDDPYWTETCWFTFAVPSRRLSGQLYPFFRPNQGVAAGACILWDDAGSQPWNCRYFKNFWHLPLGADDDLADLELANGIRYRCTEPESTYELGYRCPDTGEVEIDLRFDAVHAPNYLGEHHLDQPGRYTGTIRVGGEVIEVDDYGFRDRSWGHRSQFGEGLTSSAATSGGYSYATASPDDGFHAITMDFGDGAIVIHGYLVRDGEYATLSSGRRVVTERHPVEGAPTAVRLEAVDALGRELVAEGRCVNRIAVHLNPNLFTWNCLTEWRFGAAVGWGEDHDNWSAVGARRFFRRQLGFDSDR